MEPEQYMDLVGRIIEDVSQNPLPSTDEGGHYNVLYVRTRETSVNIGFESHILGLAWGVERQIFKPRSLAELTLVSNDIIAGYLHLSLLPEDNYYVTIFTTTDLERVFSTKVSHQGLPGKLRDLPRLNDRRLDEALPGLLQQYFGR